MEVVSEKDRDTTGQGRAIGPEPGRPCDGGRVSVPSLPERKNPSDNAIRDVTRCKRPVSREYSFVFVPSASIEAATIATARRDNQLRKPGACARNVEVGGSGGIPGGRLRRSPDRGPENRMRWRSLRRSLSVTCTLRHFPTQASTILGSSAAKTAKQGVIR